MNKALTIALIVVGTCTVAAAGSFTVSTAPAPLPSTAPPASVLGRSYLKGETLPTFSSAAARSFDFEKEGYIGTVYVKDPISFDFGPSSPGEIATPEPATLVLFASGLALARLRRKRLA